jgi:hypothetical protein
MHEPASNQDKAFVVAMSDVIAEYTEQLDLDAVVRGVGISTAYLLQGIIREMQMLPDAATSFLDQFCHNLRAVTLAIVREKDEAGDEL